MAKISKIDSIVEKLRTNLDSSYWAGKGDRKSFKEVVDRLQNNSVLSKEEVVYLKKNERKILIKSHLIHLLAEIESPEIMENTLRNLSSALVAKYPLPGAITKEEKESKIADDIKDHLNRVFKIKISSLNDGLTRIIELIKASENLHQDLHRIVENLIMLRDLLVEKGQSHKTLYEIDKLATRLSHSAKSINPASTPSKESLITEINEIGRLG